MDNLILGLSAIAILIIIALLGIPLAITMATIGLLGSLYLGGTNATFNFLGLYIHSNVANYVLSAVPLFLLMGNLIAQSGISGELYSTANKWLGKLNAGLCIVTITSCAAFAACCGSSQATAGTLGVIAIPEMKKHGYNSKIVAGSIAAGGTLGILIPPSLIFILYGIVTEQSIGKLFMAGIVPGILLALLFIVTAVIWARLSKGVAPPSSQSYNLKEKIYSLSGVTGVLLLFLLVLGGIYGGIFTPTEAAAIGSFGAFIMMLVKGKLTKNRISSTIMDTARITGMLYLMIIGAFLFQFFMAQTQLPALLVEVLETAGIGPYGVLGIVLAVFIILGFVLDAVAMMILLVPIVAPVIEASGFDLIWFGVLMVVVIEMSFITPPVGFNLFVLKSIAPEIRTSDLYAGVFPFVVAQLICLILLILFPQISLLLPGMM
jgi:C4-dicarboxylate transporter DctM subunit